MTLDLYCSESILSSPHNPTPVSLLRFFLCTERLPGLSKRSYRMGSFVVTMILVMSSGFPVLLSGVRKGEDLIKWRNVNTPDVGWAKKDGLLKL